ncbi:MAG: hypothetical protein WC081_04095 [Candidatus Ratteibacteria bacterium]|jgi:hypothetical protein
MDDIQEEAIRFLEEGREIQSAQLLRNCTMEDWAVVDHWMDGNEQLDGIVITMKCPRTSYEILVDSKNPFTREIQNAFESVMPHRCYLKKIKIRAESAAPLFSEKSLAGTSASEIKELISLIEKQKAIMISVATGGPRIQQKNNEYASQRHTIQSKLSKLKITDPNPYSDLWIWYGKWSDGSLPTYQSRRIYITNLYQPILDALLLRVSKSSSAQPPEPTGWARVDRCIEKVYSAIEKAENEEDFQTIGLLCRETIISLAQAIYTGKTRNTVPGPVPSDTDAKRMLEEYLNEEFQGSSNENVRKFSKTVFQLAVELQHKRTANFRNAALCAEATRAVVNTIAIISGQRDPAEPSI